MNELNPVIICGCPGSGTSLLARMLRESGLFLGADAGPIRQRKFHESASFQAANNRMLDWAIKFPHAPKGVHQFKKLNQLLDRKVNKFKQLAEVDETLAAFWGSDEPRESKRLWGWKDPRNSALALVWYSIFPAAKFVVLERDLSSAQRQQPSNSVAGEWFRKESTDELRKLYWNPYGVPESSIFRVDFDRLVACELELNSLLQGLDAGFRVDDFDKFSRLIELEGGS